MELALQTRRMNLNNESNEPTYQILESSVKSQIGNSNPNWLNCEQSNVIIVSFYLRKYPHNLSSARRMKAASFSTKRMKRASDSRSDTRSMLGGIALPPTPILVQSMRSPSSEKTRRPTTTPFSEATTLRLDRVQPSMQETSSRTVSDWDWSPKSLTSV